MGLWIPVEPEVEIFNGVPPTFPVYGTVDASAVVGANRAVLLLKFVGNTIRYHAQPPDDSQLGVHTDASPHGASFVWGTAGKAIGLLAVTDANGHFEHSSAVALACSVRIVGYFLPQHGAIDLGNKAMLAGVWQDEDLSGVVSDKSVALIRTVGTVAVIDISATRPRGDSGIDWSTWAVQCRNLAHAYDSEMKAETLVHLPDENGLSDYYAAIVATRNRRILAAETIDYVEVDQEIYNGVPPAKDTWYELDLSSLVTSESLVFLRAYVTVYDGFAFSLWLRKNGDTDDWTISGNVPGGTAYTYFTAVDSPTLLAAATDPDKKIQFRTTWPFGTGSNLKIDVIGYVRSYRPPVILDYLYPGSDEYVNDPQQIRFSVSCEDGLDPATLSLAVVETVLGERVTWHAISGGVVQTGWDISIAYSGSSPERIDVICRGCPLDLGATYRRFETVIDVTSAAGETL